VVVVLGLVQVLAVAVLIQFSLLLHLLVEVVVGVMKPRVQMVLPAVEKEAEMVLLRGLPVEVAQETRLL
jgi:hypothetical protein